MKNNLFTFHELFAKIGFIRSHLYFTKKAVVIDFLKIYLPYNHGAKIVKMFNVIVIVRNVICIDVVLQYENCCDDYANLVNVFSFIGYHFC